MTVRGHHEQFREHGPAEIGSDRSFCLVLIGVFSLIGLWPLWRQGQSRLWALDVAALMFVIGLVAPKMVHGLNVAWMKLALLISKITNPIITALIFFVIFTPFGFFFRRMGKDPLRLRKDPDATSYWIPRTPPGPDPGTMADQY